MLKSMFLREKSVSRYFKELARPYNKQNDLMIRYTQTSPRYIVKPFSNRHIKRRKKGLNVREWNSDRRNFYKPIVFA